MLSVACLAVAFAGPVVPERRVLLPLDYHGVRVTGGMLRNQMEEAKEDYLRIPNDDLLLGFRRRAGKPAPGQELGGWYSDDVFHVFGQILSGLARLSAATGDPACREKAVALYEGWRECIEPDGYFFASRKPNAPHYIYDKTVGGLVDVATYLGRRDALDALAKITGWAEKHLDRTRPYGADPNEWYTLSENLDRAFLLTVDKRYREFAKVWEYTPYWQCFAEGRDPFSVGAWVGKPVASITFGAPIKEKPVSYHAYSHVNTLGGAATAYRTTGDPWYLRAATNAYDVLRSQECFATGGFGPNELIGPKASIAELLNGTGATFETQCGSWAVYKLCKNLIAETGDARFGDWIEQCAYNGVAATIPMSADGRVFYYSNYNPFGAKKANHWTPWTCCTGTRPMVAADVADVTYFRAPDGLDVNLFVPSTAEFLVGKHKVWIEQSTRFPESNAVSLQVKVSRPATFALRFRRPGWLTGQVTAQINGRSVALKSDAKHWLVLNRTWRTGDRVELRLPMAPRSVPFFPSKPYPTALAVGPVVLALRSDSNVSPAGQIDLVHLGANLVPSPGEPLTYRLKGHPDVLARPYYAYKEGEPYFLYLDPAASRRIPHQKMRFEGPWLDGGAHRFSRQPGAWAEGEFDGDGVKLVAWAFDDAGRAEIRIDGKVVGTIDEYAAGRGLPFDWHITGLGSGKHTIRITILQGHHPSSTDSFVNVGGLEVIPKGGR